MYRRAASFAACAIAFAAFGTTPAAAISDYKAWDGRTVTGLFGCPNTTTIGEVITVRNKTMLNNFTFAWAFNVEFAQPGSMVVRGEVYQWDGTKATGNALWESQPRTIAWADSTIHKVAFKTGPVPLQPNTQYVIFASIDKDFAQCTPNYALAWGYVDDAAYPGGTMVGLNSGGDYTQWTTQPWIQGIGMDEAFSAAVK
jgi:hypothetical protein